MAPSVLIVDDEIDLVRLVRYNLEKEGFLALTAYDGRAAWAQIREHQPDLLILDLMLPDISGIKLCQQLKADDRHRDMPVIMLTARSSETDRVTGFEAGADDYVTKPFSPKELVLRVKAMLGRTMQTRSAASAQRIQLGALTIYPQSHCVESSDGIALPLSSLEFKLLLSLAQAPNMVKTREQLIAEIWEQEGENISDRAVDTHIKRLRQKLGGARDVIETIRGIGYRAVATRPQRALAR